MLAFRSHPLLGAFGVLVAGHVVVAPFGALVVPVSRFVRFDRRVVAEASP